MLWLVWCLPAVAGGGPMNVLVLYNGQDSEAAGVASYYADVRSIPAAQLCPVAGVDPLAQSLTFEDYAATVQPALRTCLAGIPAADEIDYIVTIRGLPYRVDITDGYSASLEAMLQIDGATDGNGLEIAGQAQAYSSGLYLASIDNPAFVAGYASEGDFTEENPYAGSYQSAPEVVKTARQPKSFRRSAGWASGGAEFTGHLFVVTRLDGFDYDDAMDLVDRGAAADGTFPTADILCMRGADEARAARDPECEYTTRMLTAAGFSGTWVDTHDAALAGFSLAAYFTGTQTLTEGIAGNEYVPGAIADNLTSTGAYPQNFYCSDDGLTCPASEAQTSIARYIRAGATGAHGAVNEPLNNSFPLASALLFYTFGYNLGESQMMALRYLYWQNLFLGDPLATPYGERPVVTLSATQTIPRGEPLLVTATHPDGVAEIRVYIDGAYVGGVEGDQASVAVEGDEGDIHEVIAVAIAENVEVQRDGWPEPNQEPRADVQGWVRVMLEVGPSGDGPDTADTSDTSDTSEPCGCGQQDVSPWPAAMIAATLLLRRREADDR